MSGIRRPRVRLPSLPDALPGPPIPASIEDVRVWAASVGIIVRSWEDLPAVNEAREDRMLLPYKRLFPTLAWRR